MKRGFFFGLGVGSITVLAVVSLASLTGLISAQGSRTVQLRQGWNQLVWTGESQAADTALAPIADKMPIAYGWQGDSQTFSRYVPGNTDVSTMSEVAKDSAYWLLMTQDFSFGVPTDEVQCPTPTPCPDCPSAYDSMSAFCAGIKAGIEVDELLLEIAKAGKLVGPSGQVDPSEIETRLADSNQLFDIVCQGVPLAEPSSLTSQCAVAGKWKGIEDTMLLYAPSAQYQAWANQFDDIIDHYCEPPY